MIETKFIKEIVKEFQIAEFIAESLSNVGFARAELHKTPLGEKIVIYASRPGLIVGRKGENIQKLTKIMKSRFKLENPQIEIVEVEKPMLDPNIVAERIASSLERFGSSKFKGIGHKMMSDVMNSGAQGVEIIISGKIPSSRAKRWRFYQGYLKKSGDIAVSGVLKSYAQAKLKTGIVGIQVRIMPPDLQLPDKVVETTVSVAEEKEEEKPVKKKPAKKKTTKKKSEPKSEEKADQEPESKSAAEAEKNNVSVTNEANDESKTN
ncbi:30S ribosomal protein S3 [Candidatus Woesearchaeota archaeon]|nr:30S ribosomal protein S3 [Candidatus Woesearchaeota archaeon]